VKTGTAFDFQVGDGVPLTNGRAIRSDRCVAACTYCAVLTVCGHGALLVSLTSHQPTFDDNSAARNVYSTMFGPSAPQPSRLSGRYWVGTYEQRPANTADPTLPAVTPAGTVQGDEPVGTLASQPFIIGGTRIRCEGLTLPTIPALPSGMALSYPTLQLDPLPAAPPPPVCDAACAAVRCPPCVTWVAAS
jgi:hypothetical protein